MSIKKLILFSTLIVICLNQSDNSNSNSAPDYEKELTCGKKNPEKDTDCTKYGTGSSVLCCWVASSKSSTNGKCFLFPETLADSNGIDGEKEFENGNNIDKDNSKYWSCGNKSTFLNINIIMILIILFSI